MRTLPVFLSSIFFQHIAFGLLVPIIVVWQRGFGLSFAEIGIIQAIGFLTIIISEIPSSYAADIFGKKKTMLFGSSLLVMSFGILINASSFYLFLLADIFLKLGLAFLSGTEESYLHDINQKAKGVLTKNLGLMSIADESGTIFGMGLSSLIIYFWNPVISFYVATASLLIALSLLIVTKGDKKGNPSTPEVGFSITSLKNFLLMGGILLTANALLSERGALVFQASLKESGIAIGLFGFIYMFAKLFSILGSSIAHIIEEKKGSLKTIHLAALLQAIAFSLLIPGSKVYTFIGLAVFFFAENIFRNVRSSFVLSFAPSAHRTTALSMVSFSSAIVLVGLQPAIGLLTDIRLHYAILFIVGLKILAFLMLSERFLKK